MIIGLKMGIIGEGVEAKAEVIGIGNGGGGRNDINGGG